MLDALGAGLLAGLAVAMPLGAIGLGLPEVAGAGDGARARVWTSIAGHSIVILLAVRLAAGA